MFINPTNSDQIARTIQHDYEQDAANYRLSDQASHATVLLTVAKAVASFGGLFFIIDALVNVAV